MVRSLSKRRLQKIQKTNVCTDSNHVYITLGHFRKPQNNGQDFGISFAGITHWLTEWIHRINLIP